MANALDEYMGPINPMGRDINVINRQLPVQVGFGSTLFQMAIWLTFPLLAVLVALAIPAPTPMLTRLLVIAGGVAAGIIAGCIWQYSKTRAHNYFMQLEQKIQGEASNIDNYLEQRVIILQNLAGLVSKAINLDTSVMESVAALRSGMMPGRIDRNMVNQQADSLFRGLSLQVEAYPDLKAHAAIAEAIRQNDYLQREITAARSVYNDRIYQWNRDIFEWPTRMIVAASEHFTTRIPFIASAEVKAEARKTYF